MLFHIQIKLAMNLNYFDSISANACKHLGNLDYRDFHFDICSSQIKRNSKTAQVKIKRFDNKNQNVLENG